MKKKLMICVELSNDSVELYKKELKKLDLSHYSEIHLVHGLQLQVYSDTIYVITYPQEDQYDDIEKSVEGVMKDFVASSIGEQQGTRFVPKCLISSTPKDALADYAKDHAIDAMLIVTRAKSGIAGLFSSSFAEYMVRHASCELRIVRGD